jgi:hypothetical protein
MPRRDDAHGCEPASMVQMPIRRSLAVVMAAALFAAGCGADDESGGTIPPVTPVPTLGGVGAVPATPSAVREPVIVVRPPVNADGTEAELLGSIVDGNRVLMIGDSILASTSSRYGNHMCEAVVPLGWQVAIEAEPSRFVEFGNQVLDRLLRDDADPEEEWNAAVVFLGTNYRGNAVQYEAELVEILDRLAPRPVVLFTVTEYRSDYVEVNEVVNRLGAERDNVTVLDWKTISEAPGILSNDRLHPTDTGRRVLAESVAAALGPVAGDGECVRSTFRDDSVIRGDSSTVLGRPSSGSGTGGSGGSNSTTTTIARLPAPVTTSTVATGSGGVVASTTTTPAPGVTTTTAAPTTTSTATATTATTTTTTPDPSPTPTP